MSPTTRIVLTNFWEYVAFLANSLVFLLISLQVNIPVLFAAWQPIVWAILAVLIARGAVVYGFSWIINRFDELVPFNWQHVLTWGGLRGAISLALVLSLPATLGAERDLLQVMAFGVLLFTLLVQGTTMAPLLRRLHITTRNEIQEEYEMRHARLVALRAAGEHLDQMQREGLISTHVAEIPRSEMDQRTASLADVVREMLRSEPALEAEELDTARREMLRAQRSALLNLRHDGVISENVFEKLAAEIDAHLTDADLSRPIEEIQSSNEPTEV